MGSCHDGRDRKRRLCGPLEGRTPAAAEKKEVRRPPKKEQSTGAR